MSVEITLVRHGETTANAAGIWQGQTNSGFTATGREQVKRLAERMGQERFDLAVASDLGRAVGTIGALDLDFETDPRWRELDVGSWEGRTLEDFTPQEWDLASTAFDDRSISLGGGESISQLIGRLTSALDDLVDRLVDGQRALVVAHGGALFALVNSILGGNLTNRLVRLTNTSVTRLEIDERGTRVSVYNDVSHLPGSPLRVPSVASGLVLVRHGQTQANLDGRWQGHSDGHLTAEGRRQARLLAARFPPVGAVYSSPLARAADTALAVASHQVIEVQTDGGLCEIGFGSWENHTVEEIAATDPEGLERLVAGEDLPRGGDGETFGGVAKRFAGSAERIVLDHEGELVAAVSHGGATRAYVAAVLGLSFERRHRLGLLSNSAMGRVVYTEHGPALAAWNLTPHLTPG